MAIQVPVAPAGKVRRYVKPVGIPAGVCHRYHNSRWKHRCDGDIFSCRLVWVCPDLAHEPHPGPIYSWEELSARFVANFTSSYQQHGVEAHLHAVRQEPGRLSGRSSPASPRCEVLYLAFPMLPSSRPSAREYGMRKCWRSWPRMTWRLSPHSSLWPTSAPEPPRAVHGTRPRKPGLPKRVARVPSPRTINRKRRRTAITTSCGPPL
jgi:hypothetical protein